MSGCRPFILTAVMLCIVSAGPFAAAQDTAEGARVSVHKDVTPEAEKAIEKGLSFLARNQNPDGSFPLQGKQGDVGITGLGGIAFMAAGSVPGRGMYGKNVERALTYVLKNTNMTTGYINSGNSRMYQHGFAMLFLAEVFGMTPEEDVRKGLIQAIRLLKMSQSPEGGWRYSPRPEGADISLTITQIMALRAARNGGIRVEPKIINDGIKYVESCAMPDGRFSYTAGGSPLGNGWASTAAGVATLFYAGRYDNPKALKGLEHMHKNIKNAFSGNSYPMYGNYYAVQAMHMAQDREKYWNKYFPHVRDHLLRTQKSDGSWSFSHGTVYSTAMACIILQVPNEYLPILNH